MCFLRTEYKVRVLNFSLGTNLEIDCFWKLQEYQKREGGWEKEQKWDRSTLQRHRYQRFHPSGILSERLCFESDLDDDQIVMGVLEGKERNPTSCSWRPYIEEGLNRPYKCLGLYPSDRNSARNYFMHELQ